MSLQYHYAGQVPFNPSTLSLHSVSQPALSWSLPPHLLHTPREHSPVEAAHAPFLVTPDHDRPVVGLDAGTPQFEEGDSLNSSLSALGHDGRHTNPDPSQSTKSLTTCTGHQMKAKKTKATIGVLAALISYVSLNSWAKSTYPEAFIWCDEDREEAQWLATSKSWLDQKACRWLSICGAAHLHFEGAHFGRHVRKSIKQPMVNETQDDWHEFWNQGKGRPEDWSADERVLRHIPSYVTEYAPYVHLFSGEQFWPCDIAEHLHHITPTLNYTPLREYAHPTLHNIDQLNKFEHGRYLFLQSNDNPEERPDWLEGEKNIPNPPTGEEELPTDSPQPDFEDDDIEDEHWHDALESHEQSPFMADLQRLGHKPKPKKGLKGGYSDAPAVLVVVDKGDGIVDAFWFFFYSFNLGNMVLNIRFGNHVGDWEHTCIRFRHGEPEAVYFSEHSFGSAYTYDAVEKMGKRPVIYSATGTHAMYPTPAIHRYILPWGLLHDETDRGPLWDPSLNLHAYTYDYLNQTLRASQLSPKAPIEWFFFNGHWGDKFYPLGDSRQYRFAGQYHYVNGPLGPKFKALGRKQICEGGTCVVKKWLDSQHLRLGRGRGPGKGDELTDQEFWEVAEMDQVRQVKGGGEDLLAAAERDEVTQQVKVVQDLPSSKGLGGEELQEL